MAEPIFQVGPQSQKVDAKTQLVNGALFVEDWKTSSQNQSFLQRGSFTLAGSKFFITLPRAYISASNLQNPPTFIVTSQTANHVFVESIAKNSAFGSNTISTLCGFTISATGSSTGTDSGYWMVIGYK